MLTLLRDPLPEGLLAGFGIVLAAAYALRRAQARGIDPAHVYVAFVGATLGALAGGHALFVATHGGNDWLRFWGDQSIFGVIIGGGVAASVYLRMKRQPLLLYADLAAPGVALGYAVARLGCLLHGDDFGAVTSGSWGIRYLAGTEAWLAHVARGWIDTTATTSLPVVPVQLALALAGCAIFAVLTRAQLRPGGALAIAAMLYGVARLALEPLRDDFRPIVGMLSLPQLFALALLGAGTALLLLQRHATTSTLQWRPGGLQVRP